MMHRLLEKILEEKQNEVARLKKSIPVEGEKDLLPLRDFKAAISIPAKINLIAEIKFASPSAGLIRA
jgi:indole-3-glycerol phosphate synthase